MNGGLTDVSSSSLERIRDALQAGSLRAPLSRAGLVAFGVRGQLDALVWALEGHTKEACLSIVEAVLAERRRHMRPAPELVWTGPEGTRASARDTAVVLRELFERSRRRVVLAGYSFGEAESVLAPLHAVMHQHGVEAHFFVDVKQPNAAQADEDAYGRAALEAFLHANWPFAAPYPALYCDRRALRPGKGAEYCSLHAKCVAVDGEHAFISSANFTARGQERNIEAGVLMHDATFAQQLERQWMSLVEGGFCLCYARYGARSGPAEARRPLAGVAPQLARSLPRLARADPRLARRAPQLARVAPHLGRVAPHLDRVASLLAGSLPQLARRRPPGARVRRAREAASGGEARLAGSSVRLDVRPTWSRNARSVNCARAVQARPAWGNRVPHPGTRCPKLRTPWPLARADPGHALGVNTDIVVKSSRCPNV